MRQRLRIAKPGLAQRSPRRRRGGRKGEDPPASRFDLRHGFGHCRCLADPGQATNAYYLVAAIEDMLHRRPLFLRKRLVSKGQQPGFQRGMPPSPAPHRIDERHFFRQHFDRSAKLLAGHLANHHAAPLKFPPRLFRGDVSDAKMQRFRDQAFRFHDRVPGKDLFARLIERHFRRDFFAPCPRLTVKGFENHRLFFRCQPPAPRRQQVRVTESVPLALSRLQTERMLSLGIGDSPLIRQPFDLLAPPRKLVDDTARNPADFPAVRCPFDAKPERRQFGRQPGMKRRFAVGRVRLDVAEVRRLPAAFHEVMRRVEGKAVNV